MPKPGPRTTYKCSEDFKAAAALRRLTNTSGKIQEPGLPVKNIDGLLGRFVLRLWAVVAFMASLVSIGFGVAVISTAIFPGVLLFLLGGLFFWLGSRAWRDNGTLGAILNRDYEPASKRKTSRK